MSHISNSMPIPLLQTKLVPPQLPQTLVQRESLLRELDTVFSHRLVLISASAGSGKTTLLSSWVTHVRVSAQKIAWLSLDEMDNTSTSFWSSVIASLRICLPAVGEIALRLLHSPHPARLSAVVAALINEILEQPQEITLILDDYQVIEDQSIHESLTFFLDHLPANLHLMLASRSDPGLPLSRWRTRGYLVEIRDYDLRFTSAEANTFLTQTLGQSFSAADVNLLQGRTEGWIAGLHLAALALRKHSDHVAFLQAFAGSHRYLMDYVQQEILPHQPEQLQQFLLQIAICSHVNVDLCRAVTDEPNSQQLLETLERNNLFLIPLDEERHWYRLHDLFREALLVRLQATQPELVPRLHLRAAYWHEKQGEIRKAVTHALAAADFSYAVSLMELTAEGIWLNGDVKILYRWVMMLPAAVAREHVHLILTAALYLLNGAALLIGTEHSQAIQEGEQMIALVESSLQRKGNDSLLASEGRATFNDKEIPLLKRRARLLRLWIAAFDTLQKMNIEQLQIVAEEMWRLDADDEELWQMIPLSTTFILRQSLLREGVPLIPLLIEANQRARQTNNRYSTIKTMQWLAMCYLSAGQLYRARQESLAALDLISQMEGHASLAGYFYIYLANVLYQWNQLEEAQKLIDRLIHEASTWQQFDLHVSGYATRAKIELALGRVEDAHQTLRHAEEFVQQYHLEGHSFWVQAVRVQYWLAVGDLGAASDWATRVVFSQERWNPNRYETFLMMVRVSLSQQQFSQALELLEDFRAKLDRPAEDIITTIEYLALYLVVLQQGGKGEQALEVLTRLLAMTEPGSFIRVYLDAGVSMRQVLQRFLISEQHTVPPALVSYAQKILDAFASDQRQEVTERDISHASISLVHIPSQVPSLLPEPLTQREQEVLLLLAEGASNQDIARQLVVSLATAKKHVANILHKLGAENRTQAIAYARSLSLL